MLGKGLSMSIHFRTLLCGLTLSTLAYPQQLPNVVIEVDVENLVFYAVDSVDLTRLATDQGRTTIPTSPTFRSSISIGDVVAVNGTRAKGVYISRAWNLQLTPTPARGQAISDTTRAMAADATVEIMQDDGTAVGSLMMAGLAGGAAAPGSPAVFTGWNLAVTGGTGYFAGAQGTSGVGQTPVAIRNASLTEDPANRRTHGGGTRRYILSVIPMTRPAITSVMHDDFTPVTKARPARRGETLIVSATGLGPVVPGVESGAAFPAAQFAVVNSPLAVSVGGQNTEPVNKIGWPGQVEVYRVDFRVPDGTPAGMVPVKLTAAWIPGPEVRIPVQQ
ncbi:MAG: hypothetical protein FJW39_09420 [Acidobacteria bacterium]|nr:hypothetical protein [Acidobacteriota bacterium]